MGTKRETSDIGGLAVQIKGNASGECQPYVVK